MRRIQRKHPKLSDGKTNSSFYGVADVLGSYPTNIKRVADGDAMPGAAMLYRIAQVMGVPVEEFFRPIPVGSRHVIDPKPTPAPKRKRKRAS